MPGVDIRHKKKRQNNFIVPYNSLYILSFGQDGDDWLPDEWFEHQELAQSRAKQGM